LSFANSLKPGVAGLAVVAALTPGVSVANDVPASLAGHPLLTRDVGDNFRVNLFNAANQGTLQLTGSQTQAGLASLSAGGLVLHFEAALAKPLDRPQMVWFPTPKHLKGHGVPVGTIVVGAVVPPQALYPLAGAKDDGNFKGNPPFCAYVDDTVLWKGVVNAFNGTATTDDSPNVAPAPGKSVCQPFLLAKGMEMIQEAAKLASSPPDGSASAPK